MISHEEYLHLPLSNDFMFGEVMQDEEISREFLEKLLDKEIQRIEYINTQDDIHSRFGAHGIRMDVYIEDGKGTVYNVEIQNVNQHNIEKRARYYQSLIDSRMLEKGRDYDELNDAYIIFICTFDYFKMGLAKYNVARYIEGTEMPYDDGAHCIILNCRPEKLNVNRSISEFLSITGGNEAASFSTDLAERVRSRLDSVRTDSQKEVSYMTFETKINDRIKAAIKEGEEKWRNEGRVEGRLESLISLARDNLISIEIAAKKSGLSVEEFTQRMDTACACEDASEYADK